MKTVTITFTFNAQSIEDARSVVMGLNAQRQNGRELKSMGADKGLPRFTKAETDEMTTAQKHALHLWSAYYEAGEVMRKHGFGEKTVEDAAKVAPAPTPVAPAAPVEPAPVSNAGKDAAKKAKADSDKRKAANAIKAKATQAKTGLKRK